MINLPPGAELSSRGGGSGVPPFDFSGWNPMSRNPQETAIGAMPAQMGGAVGGYGIGSPSGMVGGGKPMQEPTPPPMMSGQVGGGKPQGRGQGMVA